MFGRAEWKRKKIAKSLFFPILKFRDEVAFFPADKLPTCHGSMVRYGLVIYFCFNIIGRVPRLRWNTHWQDFATFDSLLSRVGLGHLGKGWIVRDTTT